MTGPEESASVPAAAFPLAFVPLGSFSEGSWFPLGAGVLLADAPVAWLVTSRQLLEETRDVPLAAFLVREDTTEVLDLTDSLASSGLTWLEDPDNDLAACLFPLDPSLGLKGFPQRECVPTHELRAFLPVSSVCCPYGAELGLSRPTPMMFDGVLSHVDAENSRLYTTAPLLPSNVGAPLGLAFGLGGSLKLLGILTESLLVPEHDPRHPPVRIGRAVSAEPMWNLVRSEAARAQRQAVLSQAAGESSPPD